MKKLAVSAVAASGLLFAAGSANAASVSFVFQNPGADTPVAGNFTTGANCNGINVSGADLCTIDDAIGFDYAKGFASLKVTAYNLTTPVGLTGFPTGTLTSLLQDLAPTNSGLAVLSDGEGSSDDQVQVSTNEALLFDFGTDVALNGMDFNAGADTNCATPGSEGPCGNFDLFVDGSWFGNFVALDDMDLGWIVGSTFGIVATGPVDGGFSIGSMDVSEVPVPGAAIAMITGLAGLGAARRRRKAA